MMKFGKIVEKELNYNNSSGKISVMQAELAKMPGSKAKLTKIAQNTQSIIKEIPQAFQCCAQPDIYLPFIANFAIFAYYQDFSSIN